MSKGRSATADFLEPFLLGLSCLVGGDQFYIHLSHTKVSIRIQSFVLLVVTILVLIASAFMEANYSYLNGFHCYYVVTLSILLIIVKEKATSPILITIFMVSIGCIVTLLIVQSCSHYAMSRIQLLSFIFGLFSSKFLPTICWYFVIKRGMAFKSQLHSVSVDLAICRLTLCIVSILLKTIVGRFKFNLNVFPGGTSKIIENFQQEFEKLKEYKDKYWFKLEWHKYGYSRLGFYSMPCLVPFVSFIVSVLVYMVFPPVVHSLYYRYSSSLISLLDMIRIGSHLFGTCFGIAYPLSYTSNNFLHISFNLAFYVIYLIMTIVLYYREILFSSNVLYALEMISGFALGYLWPYNLGIVVNTAVSQTCTHEELSYFPCCGPKFEDECYCRHPDIMKQIPEGAEKQKWSRPFECSKLVLKNKMLEYSPNGKNAVLITVCGANLSKKEKKCLTACREENDCTSCLRLIGVYSLGAVTTNSCNQCQLTVRLEANQTKDEFKCPICEPGSSCNCSSIHTGKCCSMTLKCCSASCNKETLKFCCCSSSCDKCKHEDDNGVRVFIAYPMADQDCCIREIKQNEHTNFDGDFTKHFDFDIFDIFISDCCHVDLQVDLHCIVKNNFFRLSGINYPKKYEYPKGVLLKSNYATCETKKHEQCCCLNKNLVRVALTYDGDAAPPACTRESAGSSTACCPSSVPIEVDEMSSFLKRLYPHRVKMIVLCWLVFGLLFFLCIMILFGLRLLKSRTYTFNPKTSYSSLVGTFSSNRFNSDSQINNRLNSLIEIGKITDFSKEKKRDLELMLSALENYMGAKGAERMHEYLMAKAKVFVGKSKNPDIKKLDYEVVAWAHAVGVMYKYVVPHFFELQKFFADWEEIWAIEYANYREAISLSINRFSLKSQFSLTMLGDFILSEDSFDAIEMTRLVSWSRVLRELKLFSNLNDRELKLTGESLPVRIGSRLEHYVERWSHRIENIVHWRRTGRNIFSWGHFLNEYQKIEAWVMAVGPHLRVKSDLKFPLKKLNGGTKVFLNYKIK